MLNTLVKKYSNYQPDREIDQVVSLIFKNINNQPLSILFLQRNYHPKDRYSGDICFPGGHRQKGQSLIDTATRQTLQQISLDLNKQGQYLGILDNQFFTGIGKNKTDKVIRKLYSSVLVFEVNTNVDIKLNKNQIRDYRWIPVKNFLDDNTKNLIFKDYKYKHKVDYVQISSVQIGMQSDLWGVTFNIMTYLLKQMIDMNLQQFGFKCQKQNIQKFIDHNQKIIITYDKQRKQMIKDLQIFRKAYMEERYLKPKF